MPLATKLFFAAILVCICGCERFQSAELDGAVFVRMGSGETRPQGGLEVLLVAPEIKKEMASIQSTFEKRIEERKRVSAAAQSKNATLRDEARKWKEETAAKINIRILSARPDIKDGWLILELSVANNTQFRLTYVLYQIFCGDRQIPPTGGDNTMFLLGTPLTERFLDPGQTRRTPSWGEYFRLAEKSRFSEEGKSLLSCPLETLRAKSVGFGVYKPDGDVHNVDQLASTPAIEDIRRSVEPLQKQLNAIGTAGVADLDVAVGKLLRQHTKYSTHTGLDGRYRIPAIKPGAYILVAFYSSALDDTGWFVPIDVRSKTNQDLSNFNFSDPRFAQRWKRPLSPRTNE